MDKSKEQLKKRGKGKRIRKKKLGDVVTDPRFSKLHSDPRFARFPAQKRKVKVDDRFSALFSDPAFKTGAQNDKWGRKVDLSKHNEEMQRLYQLNEEGKGNKSVGKVPDGDATNDLGQEDESDAMLEEMSTSSDEIHSDAEEGKAAKKQLDDEQHKTGSTSHVDQRMQVKSVTLTPEEIQRRADQVARMRGMLGGSSSEEMDSADEPLTDEEGDDDSDDLELWGVGALAGNPEEDIPKGEATRRLAVIDLDWENIRSVDILNVMRSFLPTGGQIDKVSVFVSEYGKERMATEAAKGPGALGVFGKVESDQSDEEDPNNQSIGKKRRRGNRDGDEEKGGDVDVERVRKYERSKLRYYYAVVDCDSVEVASHLVQELDGREFETSQCLFDMRYIPDDMDFDTNDCRDTATEVPEDYEPPRFECNALTKTNVKLTWDDDDKQRTRVVRRKFKDEDLLDEDFKVYLASASEHGSDSDEGGEDIEAIRARYKSLFGNFGENSNESDSSFSSSDSETSDSGKPKEKIGREDGSLMELEEISDDEQAALDGSAEDLESLDEDDLLEGGEVDKEITFHVGKMDGKKADDHSADSKDGKAEVDAPVVSGHREKTKKRKTKDTGAGDCKSQADLELLLLDDNVLKAARQGGGALEGKSSASGKRQKLSKKERVRLAKLRKEMSKRGSDEEEANDNDFQVDLSDSRFKGMFTSSEFAIDPTHPAYKRTKGAADLMKEVARVKSKTSKGPKEDASDPEVGEHTLEQKDDLKSMAEKLKRKSILMAVKKPLGRANKRGSVE